MPRTLAEIDSFITMMRVACENPQINATLQRILSLPDEQRRGLVHAWVSDMLVKQAPKDFIEAIACLADDAVAERAYAVIYHCERG